MKSKNNKFSNGEQTKAQTICNETTLLSFFCLHQKLHMKFLLQDF